MTKRNTSQPGRNRINRLPDEVLREIFLQYNCMGNGSTMCLLRVCRIWKSIVSSTSALWNRICFAPILIIRKFESFRIDELASYITCATSQQLARAIRRLHNTKFELICCLIPELCSTDSSYWEELEPVWFEQQCRSLSLLVEGSLDRFPHLFHKMGALEEFAVFDMNYSYLNMFRELELFSPRLHTLVIRGELPSEISRFTILFSRLKSLALQSSYLPDSCLCDLLAAATSLEELDLDESTQPDFATRLTTCSNKLSHVALVNAGISLFTGSGAYAQVVDLEIRFTNNKAWPFNENHLEIEMPLLQSLVLEGKWTALRCVRATALRFLRLGRSKEAMKERLEHIHTTQLRPQVLRIDRCVAESELISVLQTTWEDISELHITVSSRNDYLRAPLIKAMSGPRGREPICPKLRTITVLLLKPEAAHGHLIGAMTQSMKFIEMGRRHLRNLELLRCGWVQWTGGKLYDGGMETWPNQEWIDFV